MSSVYEMDEMMATMMDLPSALSSAEMKAHMMVTMLDCSSEVPDISK